MKTFAALGWGALSKKATTLLFPPPMAPASFIWSAGKDSMGSPAFFACSIRLHIKQMVYFPLPSQWGCVVVKSGKFNPKVSPQPHSFRQSCPR